MASQTTHRKPSITLTQTDHTRLSKLAESHSSRSPDIADELLAELERARIVSDEAIAKDVVRMGSTLRFVSDLGEDRAVTLVFPGEADIAKGKVSILTPIGTALTDFQQGNQSTGWLAMGKSIA